MVVVVVVGVGNARLFNGTHELLLEIGMGGGVMFMFKIKFNVVRATCNVGGVTAHVIVIILV